MSGHEKAGPDSRKLCDSLFAEMVGLHPGIVRDELAGSCALYQPGNNRFAYMFHSSQPHVYVFVRNATAFHKSSLQKGVTISLQQEGEESINYHRGAMLPDGAPRCWRACAGFGYQLSPRCNVARRGNRGVAGGEQPEGQEDDPVLAQTRLPQCRTRSCKYPVKRGVSTIVAESNSGQKCNPAGRLPAGGSSRRRDGCISANRQG